MPTFFGEIQFKGERKLVDVEKKQIEKLSLFYLHPHGELWQGNSIEWLKSMKDESVDLIFADPPYNIKKQIGTPLKVKKNT